MEIERVSLLPQFREEAVAFGVGFEEEEQGIDGPSSSYPTYPGGAPTRRDTVNFSMYSLMSIRIRFSAESNMYFAKHLAK